MFLHHHIVVVVVACVSQYTRIHIKRSPDSLECRMGRTQTKKLYNMIRSQQICLSPATSAADIVCSPSHHQRQIEKQNKKLFSFAVCEFCLQQLEKKCWKISKHFAIVCPELTVIYLAFVLHKRSNDFGVASFIHLKYSTTRFHRIVPYSFVEQIEIDRI